MSGWCVDKKGGHVAVVGPDGTEDAACGTFLDRLLLRGLSLHTVEAYAYDLVLMRRWLYSSGLQLAEMNADHLHQFVAWERGRESKPKSINRRLHTPRLFFQHVTKRELPGATIPRRGKAEKHCREMCHLVYITLIIRPCCWSSPRGERRLLALNEVSLGRGSGAVDCLSVTQPQVD
jgi:Phage integrase, N-terminal SAM-like domain